MTPPPTGEGRFWTWAFRLWEAYEVLGSLFGGIGALGIAFVAWRADHDGLALMFVLVSGIFLLIAFVTGFFWVRQVRDERNGKWG